MGQEKEPAQHHVIAESAAVHKPASLHTRTMIARVLVGFGMNLSIRDDVKERRRRDLATSADKRECAAVSKARGEIRRIIRHG